MNPDAVHILLKEYSCNQTVESKSLMRLANRVLGKSNSTTGDGTWYLAL